MATKPRPSPTQSATTLKPGTRRKGNDNNMWVVTQTSTGTHRWQKLKEETINSYFTHDGLSRPYKVTHHGSSVDVYTNPISIYPTKGKPHPKPSEYNEPVKTFNNVEHMFIGTTQPRNKKSDGNSILLRLKNNKYIFIGYTIYSFKTKEEIKEYYSNIDDFGYPIPVGLTDNYVYFFSVLNGGKYIRKSEFKDIKNPYTDYEKQLNDSKSSPKTKLPSNRFEITYVVGQTWE